jgi:hypothetical protein
MAPFLAVAQRACNGTDGLQFGDMPTLRLPSGETIAKVFPYPWAQPHAPGGLDGHWYLPNAAHAYYAYYVSRYVPRADFATPALLASKLVNLSRSSNFLLQVKSPRALGRSNPRRAAWY